MSGLKRNRNFIQLKQNYLNIYIYNIYVRQKVWRSEDNTRS